MIDPALVRQVEQELRRDDVELTIATPEDYGDVEAASRAACEAGDVLTPLTAELIGWFVDRNPCGPGFVVIACPPGESRVLGHFVFYPWALKLRMPEGGIREVPAYIHIRLWVSDELRRRGVFLSMTRFGLTLLERMGVGIAYTVPNQRSAPGFLKLGEQHAGDLPFWVRPLLPGWALLAGARVRGIEVERRDRFDETFGDAGTAAVGEEGQRSMGGHDREPAAPTTASATSETKPASFDAARDAAMPAAARAWSPRRAELLNWRYPERPDFDYDIRYLHTGGRPVGYLVTRRMRIKGVRTLAVCDFWTAPGHDEALRAGLDDAIRRGGRAELAVAFGGNVAGTERALRAAAFVRCPRPLQPQPVSVIGGGIGDEEQRFDLPPFDGWYLTPCDWDVF